MSNTATHTGVSFFSLLGVAFIVLKLGGWTDVAQWSWWWVLAPLWGPPIVFGWLFVVIAIGYAFIRNVFYNDWSV